MRIAKIPRGLVLSLALACAGCASNVYKDEAQEVADSAKALSRALSAPPGAPNLDLAIDLVLLGGPIRYDADCGRLAFAAYEGVIRTADGDQAARDQAYAALLRTPACGLATVPSPEAAPLEKEGTDTDDDKGDGFAARHPRRDEERQAAQAPRRPLVAHGPPPPAQCKGSCSLEDYTRQVAAYGEAIEAAGKADDVEDAQGALDKAGDAAKGLLAAAKAPSLAGPVVDLLAGLGKMAIQQARYAAMKRAVIVFDAAWSQAWPAVEEAARLRQAERISIAADAAANASFAAEQYLNDGRYFRSPAERLRLFESLNGKVDAANAALNDAKIDPAKAIDAFTRANHSLALALENPRTQAGTLRADVKDLGDEVGAVRKGANP